MWISTTKQDENQMQIFENKIMRRIYGYPITKQWEIRSYKKIYTLFNLLVINAVMKNNRLSWLGHVERMEKDRQTKTAYAELMKGHRPRGEPRQ